MYLYLMFRLAFGNHCRYRIGYPIQDLCQRVSCLLRLISHPKERVRLPELATHLFALKRLRCTVVYICQDQCVHEL
jgi:hypothetical protein